MDKTLLHRSLTIFYRVEGPENDGSIPMMLLHGFAEDNELWNGQMEYLKKKYRLLIPDLPGCGRSSPLPGESSLEDLAEFIKAILDAEGIGQVVLIGHSMGGYITLAFAARYSGRLRAFGLFHSTAYPDTEEKKAVRRKAIEFIRKNGAAAFIRQTTPNLFSEGSRHAHPEMVAELVGRYSGSDPDALITYYQAMIGRPDRTDILKEARCPVLFIIGEHDGAIPLDSILPQTHMPSAAEIHILGNAGHMGMLEEPQRSNAILEGFLSGLQRSS